MKIHNNKKNIYESGQVMLTMVIFFMFASIVIVFGVVNPILKQAAVSKNLVTSKESYFLASSALEDVYYRLKNNKTVSTTETLSLNNGTTTTIVTTTTAGKQIVSSAVKNSNFRKMQTDVIQGKGFSFNYGVQSGLGGFVLQNSSSIKGNIYSAGPVTGVGNTVTGDAVSSGSSGLINNIHTTGSAHAHTIQNSTIDANAYYVVKTATTVFGTSYPNSTDQPTLSLPISDVQIAGLESDAEGGGVISSPCPYKITSNTTLGPIKITCDLEISGSPTVTLAGSVWVTGNITIKNSPLIKISSSLGGNISIAMIADNPTDRLTGSVILLENNATFEGAKGSGNSETYIFAISQNNSSETGGSNDAINMVNSSNGEVVLYAGHGQISINNSATLRQVTGYKTILKNSANIIYETGLASTLFSSGPSGGWSISTWKEVQ